jgi:hypothetical protein
LLQHDLGNYDWKYQALAELIYGVGAWLMAALFIKYTGFTFLIRGDVLRAGVNYLLNKNCLY